MEAFERRIVGAVHVFTPARNLVGGAETVALSRAVTEVAAAGRPQVVLDLRRIKWVSSLGIEELRRMHRACTGRDGWLKLACVGERIESIILTMRLDWVFDTFDTVEEALGVSGRTGHAHENVVSREDPRDAQDHLAPRRGTPHL